jgi:pSer/pThr/pTyr-binding forkhead associated (FHA) protein
LRVGDKDVIIRDLGSTNGTLVNGCLLVGERSLQDGDRVQLGPLVLEVSVGEGTSPETAVHDTCLVDQSPTAHGDPPGNATREMRM